ncbi:MAG: hypothetical protein J0I25_06390, partial [Sphingomonadales bacterium]|nr:hypothetical protein [Sphingomonadales bacterium]
SRVETGEAIEAVATDAAPRRIAADCLVRGATAVPITLGLAAVTIDGRIEDLVAIVVRRIA